MRERALVIASVAFLGGALGCSANLTNADGVPRGTGGDLGTRGTDGSVDAIAVIACPAVAEPTGSLPSSAPAPGCPCTRAPGPGNSFQCPMGAGETASEVIGPTGGQIVLFGQQGNRSGVAFELTFPPGALAADTLISVTETDLSPPTGVLDFSPVYLVAPRGLQLAKVASVQIPWSSNLTSVPMTLGIYARDEGGTCAFSRLTDSYTNAGFEQASLTTLGYLLVGVASTVDPATCGGDASTGT